MKLFNDTVAVLKAGPSSEWIEAMNGLAEILGEARVGEVSSVQYDIDEKLVIIDSSMWVKGWHESNTTFIPVDILMKRDPESAARRYVVEKKLEGLKTKKVDLLKHLGQVAIDIDATSKRLKEML